MVSLQPFSSARPRRPAPWTAVMLALSSCLVLCGRSSAGPVEIQNPLSQFFIEVDGQFTDSLEWSDVTPAAFIAPPDNEGTLFRSDIDDPRTNSLLYAAIAPGTVGPTELYLMYDYADRTRLGFFPGEFIADIAFPLTVGGELFGESVVRIRGGGFVPTGLGVQADSFFDVFVALGDGSVLPAEQFDIEGAIGLGMSPRFAFDHMMIELEVALLIPEGFGGSSGSPFPPGGLPDGHYSPDPAFWGASAGNDAVDPPISAALFTINPNGSTTVRVTAPAVQVIPEPSTLLLLSGGLVPLIRRRRAR